MTREQILELDSKSKSMLNMVNKINNVKVALNTYRSPNYSHNENNFKNLWDRLSIEKQQEVRDMLLNLGEKYLEELEKELEKISLLDLMVQIESAK